MDALKNVEAVEVGSVEAERIDRLAKKREKTGKNKAKEIIAIGGLFLLSLVLPIFGLCYWLGVRTEKAKRAKGALIGAVISGLLCLIAVVGAFALFASIGAALAMFFSPLLICLALILVLCNIMAFLINGYLAFVVFAIFLAVGMIVCMFPFAFLAALMGV